MRRGLYINTAPANCSIFESGVMIKNIFEQYPINNVNLSYTELSRIKAPITPISKEFDFYLFNWHHWSLPIKKETIKSLPGKKICVVLDVSQEHPHPMIPKDLDFDAYMVIDPTKIRMGKVYPFPRPLELAENKRDFLDHNKFIIGSFGFLTPGKRFEELILNANKLQQDSIVRINIPPCTWFGDIGYCYRLQEFDKKLQRMKSSRIDLRLTHSYMTKQKLISWCSEHTINVFPYYRNQTGLAATTDQAISAGRGIVITNDNTFRHLHQYISYYPKQSYLELATSTIPGVLQMQEDWHPKKFSIKFEELLKEENIL
jgi:hypothetical protein